MIVLRFLGNLLLALLLALLILLVLSTAYATVTCQAWERFGLDYGVEEGGWMWIESEPIYVRTWGPLEGASVVLIHGFNVAGAETWVATAQDLAKRGIHVTAIDLKGFGHSVRDVGPACTLREQAALVAKVLNHLRTEGATVVGHGWGSGVALQLAADQPQFVGRLVLVSPLINGDVTPLWRPIARTPFLGRAFVWMTISGGPYWALTQGRDFYDRSRVPREYWQRARQVTRIVGTTDALLTMGRSPEDDDLPEAMADIQVPILILLGREDARVPIGVGRRLEGILPDAKLIIVSEAGHHVQIEQKARVSRHIAQFSLQGTR